MAAIALVAGADAQGVVAFVLGIACVVVVRWGIRAYRPPAPQPWYGVAGTVGLFLIGSVVREVEVAISGAERFPSLGDVFDAAGYVAGIASVWSFHRLRSLDRGDDRTDLIDTLIVLAGVAVLVWTFVMVPHIRDQSIPAAGRVVSVGFSFLSFALLGSVLRLAAGAGARNRSWHLLAGAVGAALAVDVFDSLAFFLWDDPPGGSTISTALTCIAFVCCGASALDPSMAELTQSTRSDVPEMSRGRLLLMLAAVVVAPVVLLLSPRDDWAIYAPAAVLSWVVISALALLRLGGLVQARERIAAREAIFARLSSEFAGATTVAELEERASAGVVELLAGTDHPTAAILVAGPDASWTANGLDVGGATVQAAIGGDRGAALALAATLGHAEAVDACTVEVPPTSHARMAVVVSAEAPLPIGAEALVAHVATTFSLAVEALGAVARVHAEAGEHRFRALVEHSSDMVAILLGESRIAFMSPAVRNLLGWDDDAVVGSELLMGVHVDDRAAFASLLKWAAAARRAGPVELRIRHADGGWRWFEAIATDRSADPLIEGTVLNARDITERKLAEQRLAASEARFRSLVQHASDVIAVIDPAGLVEYISPSSSTVLGQPPEHYIGRSFEVLVHGDDRMTFDTAILLLEPTHRSERRLELRLMTARDGIRTFDVTLTDLRTDPAVLGIVLNARDITDRKALENDLRHLASHDDLTGLSNRVLFRERVADALGRPANGDRRVGVLFLDIDDFKTVNDSLGHGHGDQLLRVIAARLRAAVPEHALPARIGGDEFAVLVPSFVAIDDLLTLAHHLIEVIAEPVDLGGRTVVVNASIGIACSDLDHLAGPEVMLRDADAAMYHAKAKGKRGVQVFDQSMHDSAIERLELVGDLAHAVERDELVLHYQPIIELTTGRLVGFEALVRWQHPTRGLLSPNSFLAIAEETGVIMPMGGWILASALEQLARWQEEVPALTMSINLAPSQLSSESIVPAVEALLIATGVRPSSVVLELTEDRVLDDETHIHRLRDLRALGLSLHADDFGSGFASYAALQRLPFTGVKIDRSLVSALGDHDDEGSAPQVRSIVEMAHAMGLEVVAEGIESEAQADMVRALGCDLAQGYLYSQPTPAATMASVLVHAEVTRSPR